MLNNLIKSLKKIINPKKTSKKKKKKTVSKKKIAKTKKKIVRAKKKVTKTKKKIVKAKKTQATTRRREPVIGRITHYFPHVKVGVIKLKAPITIGTKIRIKGYTTNFTQTITSMQVDHNSVKTAKKGAEIGILVKSRVRGNDKVYKI